MAARAIRHFTTWVSFSRGGGKALKGEVHGEPDLRGSTFLEAVLPTEAGRATPIGDSEKIFPGIEVVLDSEILNELDGVLDPAHVPQELMGVRSETEPER